MTDDDAAIAAYDAWNLDARRWRWLVENGKLGFTQAPFWDAVVRISMLDHDDTTLAEIVDRGILDDVE